MVQLEMRNLSKKVGVSYYFRNVNLKVTKKEIVGIIGKKNIGKSYLCRMLAGIDSDYSGQIINSSDYSAGLVDGKETLDSIKTIKDYFESIIELNTTNNMRDLTEVMKEVGLDISSPVSICDYTKVKKKKILIAKAILFNREFVIFDEPFFDLDDFSKIEIKSVIIKLMENHYTMLVTSPHEKDLTAICDIIYLIEGRKIKRFI